ncbi:MAG: hypothetical protein IK068_07470 [Lachnospiraceae bacterium]|nr:hypothetical protein [Lachnospiraceae bacterium]
MYGFKAIKLNRGFKALVASVLVLSLMLSLSFVAFEAHHDCEGEDCPICICLEECVNTIKGFCDSLPILSAFVAVILTVALCSFVESKELVFNTPISIKVRMND